MLHQYLIYFFVSRWNLTKLWKYSHLHFFEKRNNVSFSTVARKNILHGFKCVNNQQNRLFPTKSSLNWNYTDLVFSHLLTHSLHLCVCVSMYLYVSYSIQWHHIFFLYCWRVSLRCYCLCLSHAAHVYALTIQKCYIGFYST